MATRLFSLICGLFYVIPGIAGFIPFCVWRGDLMRLRMNGLHLHGGQLAGFLEINWAHNVLWLLMGLAGMVAFSDFEWSKLYAKGLFVATVLFTLVGLLPLGIGDLWGYLPLSGWNVPVHATTAMLAWYYGWVYPRSREMGLAQ